MTPDNPGTVTATSGPAEGMQVTPNFSTGNASYDSSAQNMMGLSGLVKALGTVSSGAASFADYGSKADTDNYNAAIASGNAASIGQETAANETNLRLVQQQKIGQQRANLAAANTGSISSGSNAGAIMTSETNANMQALTDRYRGTVARTNALNSAALDQYYAKVAKGNQVTSIFNTASGTMGQLLEGYNRYTNGSL